MADINSYHGPSMATETTVWYVANNTSALATDVMCIYCQLPRRENKDDSYRLMSASVYHNSGAAKTATLTIFSPDRISVAGLSIDAQSAATGAATNFDIPFDYRIPQEFYLRMVLTPGAGGKLVQLALYFEVAKG